MIDQALACENKVERSNLAKAIIGVMGNMNPHLRDVDDYRHKLWTHLFVMSDFKLEVDSPYEIPKQEVLAEKPDRLVYPKSSIRYGHYGKYTQTILEESKNTEDPAEKEYLKTSMANFMKKQYLSHNNDAVENNVIADHLKELSKGELVLENPDDLVNTNTLLRTLGLGANNKKFVKTNNFKQKQKKKFQKKQ